MRREHEDTGVRANDVREFDNIKNWNNIKLFAKCYMNFYVNMIYEWN